VGYSGPMDARTHCPNHGYVPCPRRGLLPSEHADFAWVTLMTFGFALPMWFSANREAPPRCPVCRAVLVYPSQFARTPPSVEGRVRH